jgi:hypothetical protein
MAAVVPFGLFEMTGRLSNRRTWAGSSGAAGQTLVTRTRMFGAFEAARPIGATLPMCGSGP